MLTAVIYGIACGIFAVGATKYIPASLATSGWKLSVIDEGPPVDPLFVNGVQLVVQNEEVLFEKSFGMASKAYNVPMHQDVRFRIGSNSKLFTTVAIYQLQEKKLLNVDDDIADYLTRDDFVKFGLTNVTSFCPMLSGDESCRTITFRQLMSMSSGMIDAFNCVYEPGSWELEYCSTVSEKVVYPGSIGSVVGTFILNPLSKVPGSTYHYDNENFILLSYIIEKLSGLSFGEYIRTKIVEVIGLKSTYYDPWGGQFSMDDNFASQYLDYSDMSGAVDEVTVFASGVCSVELNPGYCSGTGGMISSSSDMALWYKSLFLVEDCVLLSKESISAITEPVMSMGGHDPDGMSSYYAQGVAVSVKQPDQMHPSKIWYQGGTYCAATSIVLDFESAIPPVMSIAFSNARLVNATKLGWQQVQTSRVGTAMNLVAAMGWESYSDSLNIAFQLGQYFSTQDSE